MVHLSHIVRSTVAAPRTPSRPCNLTRDWNNTLFDRDRSGFGAVTDLELLRDVIDVIAHRMLADAKGIAYFLVGQALCQQFKDFQLASTQARAMSTLRESGGNGGRKIPLSRVNSGDGLNDLVSRHFFQKVAARTRLHGAINLLFE